MKTLELTEDEAHVVRECIDYVRKFYDMDLQRSSRPDGHDQTREEHIRTVRAAESVLKKLGPHDKTALERRLTGT